jgi:predicted metal-dependent HD superfamily phosphohydrolase
MVDSPEGKYILNRLRTELPPQFHYHNADHTLDVYHSAAAIAKQENVSEDDTKLLLVAALYHDCGYLLGNKDHELSSCRITREALPQFGYMMKYIEKICTLIMATQLPQQPANLLQQIICDADLDYLGRNDFATTGNKLYREMLAFGTIRNIEEWDQLQIKFLQNHRYFTASSLKNRQPKQQENLRTLQT